MATVYWTASSGSPALASTDGNWSTGAAPGAGDVAYFRNASSNYNCTWDISTQFGSIYVNNDYTGTITLACDIDMTHTSQGPVFGNTASTINTANYDVTWQHAGSSYYFSIGGTINWGTSDLTVSAAVSTAGSNIVMNIGAGTWLAGDDWRFGSAALNITGNALISGSGTPKVLGGGIWNMNGHSPTIVCSRPYNQTIQINDPGTSTWRQQYTSNDSDTWNLGSGSFYNLTIDDTNNNQEVASFVGGPAGPLDFPLKIDNNLRIEGSTVRATSYTKLVLHFDGANDGTVFNDSSGRLHTVTANGNVHTDTSVKKFGTASAQFDGTGDYLTIPANGDWDVGTGDFTIDCWVYTSTTTAAGYIFDTRNGSHTNNFALYRSGDEIHYYAQGGSIQIDSGAALTADTWHHIALVRDGSDVELFVDGVSKGTVTDANDYQGLAPLIIGSRYSDEHYWTGYMDEFRWSKDVARWDAAFTPETSAYAFVPSIDIGNDLLGFDNDAGSSAGKLDIVSGSMKLYAGADINTGFTLDAAQGETWIGGQWSAGGGTFHHNSGTVYLGGNFNGDWEPYNLVSYNRNAAYNWKNEASPYQYFSSQAKIIANNFTVSGIYVRTEQDVTVSGNMVVGIEGANNAASSGSGFNFDGNNNVRVLNVGNNITVYSGSYLGNSGFDYNGDRGTGCVGAANHRKGTIICGNDMKISGTVAAISGTSTGTGNYWQSVGLIIYNGGQAYAPPDPDNGSHTLITNNITFADIGGGDDRDDENTRFVHQSGTVILSGAGTTGIKASSAEDSNVPGIAGGSGMPALSDTYGVYNLTMKPNSGGGSYIGGAGYVGISGDLTVDTAAHGWIDRQVRVGKNLNLNQGELRIDGNTKDLWVDGNLTMAASTKLGGKRSDGSHPFWEGWMKVDGNVTLGANSELYLASGNSASDKFDFIGTQIGGNWINNGGTATE